MSYDPNEARDQQGRWAPSGGVGSVAARTARSDVSPGLPGGKAGKLDQPWPPGWTEEAHRLGLNPARMHVIPGVGPEILVGGVSLGPEAGHFDPETEMVTVYAGAINSPAQFGGVVRHEIFHAQFAGVMGVYESEARAAAREPGLAGAALAEKYPIYSSMRDDVTGALPTLRAEGGVSRYSREYWKSVGPMDSLDSQTGNHAYRRALDETLAEVHRLGPVGRIALRDRPHLARLYQHITENWKLLNSEAGQWRFG